MNRCNANLVPILLGLIVVFCVIYGNKSGFSSLPVSRDTIICVETTRVVVPSASKIVYLRDTLYLRDTIYIRESKEYKTDFYNAYISGFDVSLDSIYIYQPTKVITNTLLPKKKKFVVGPSVGYGYGGAFVGFSLTYNLFSFSD